MASYDALRHVSIGQYIPTGSVIHTLDPRTKLIGLVLLAAAAVIASSYVSSLALLLFIVGLVVMARLSLRYILSGIRLAIPVILVLSAFQLLFYAATPVGERGSSILLTWGPVSISSAALRAVVVSLLRFLDLLFLTSLLTNTTPQGALTQGIEHLLRPLNRVGLPGHEVALIASIALRFVPILGEQLESIAQAQESRRVRSERQSKVRVVENARRMANLVVPLFVDAFRRAEELALAMQARCYQGGRGRTHLHALTFGGADYVALLVQVLVLAGAVAVQRAAWP